MEENQSILDLQVDQHASKNLSEAARWAKFLSIFGFVCMGLLVIFFLASQSQIARSLADYVPGLSNDNNMVFLMVTIFIVAAIICVLMFFLFKGSTLIKKGVETKNQEVFNSGLASLKAYFTMYGILTVIGLLSTLLTFNR